MARRMNMMFKRSLIFYVFFSFPLFAADDEICPTKAIDMPASTPSAQFDFEQDGDVVTDLKTGLMWTRCPWTYTWDASNRTCVGDAVTGRMNWKSALTIADDNNVSDAAFLDYQDWRLPNIKELASIVERKCAEFSINHVVFGESGAGVYWSNTHVLGKTDIRMVDFRSGTLGVTSPTSEKLLRLVRTVTP